MVKQLGHKTHVSKLVVDEEVLLGLRDVCALPAREPGAEGIRYGGCGAGAVHQDEAQQAARVRDAAAGEHVGPGAFPQPYSVPHVEEIQNRDQVFAKRLE